MRSLKPKDESTRINVHFVVAGLTNQFYCGDRKTIKKVVERYLQLAKEAVLDGWEWDFNEAFCLCVHKKNVRMRPGKKINLRRPGERNRIVAYGKQMRVRRYRFVPFKQMKDELDYILENTNKEYRYPPLR